MPHGGHDTLSPDGPEGTGPHRSLRLEAVPAKTPEQPIFYPVMNLAYARQITREWNVPAKGTGHVVCFDVDSSYLKRFTVQNVGGAIHDELWVPAEELEEFNDHIVGRIELIETYESERD